MQTLTASDVRCIAVGPAQPLQSDATRRTARLRVTGDPAAQPRYFASLRVPGRSPVTGRFDWSGDLNRWVQSARRSAERHGWTVEIHDSSGEVR